MTVVTDGDAAPDDGAGVTFEAFARIIGRSRPYVSKLVKDGRIHGEALTADRKIIPPLAQQQIADSADPGRGAHGRPAGATVGTFATERARLVAAQAERAELDLLERRGELIPRSIVAETLSPVLRKLRDDLVGIPRDIVADSEQADQCEAAIAAALERAATEILNHGGAQPGP